MSKIYTCICGETFSEPNKFNSHKNHCKIHIELKYGSYDLYKKWCTRSREQAANTLKQITSQKRSELLANWIEEKHTCEKCGKVMTEKFGSGRFCSRQCANSHKHTEASKQKARSTVNKNNAGKLLVKQEDYYLHANYCIVCGSIIEFSKRHRKTCCEECKRSLLSSIAKENGFGGPSTVSSYGKRGVYKGIHCDSTYELAFLIYCLDNDIKIIRNEVSFPYLFDNKVCNYYPDFYLPQYNTYIEIKGRDIGPVYLKLEGVSSLNLKIKLLHFEELIPCFKHVVSNYKNTHFDKGNNNFYILYDS